MEQTIACHPVNSGLLGIEILQEAWFGCLLADIEQIVDFFDRFEGLLLVERMIESVTDRQTHRFVERTTESSNGLLVALYYFHWFMGDEL